MALKKYKVQCWSGNLQEEQTNSYLEALRAKQKMKLERPESYCCIIKVPFRKRYPDFPLWFAIISLWFVIFAQEVEMCICHILQIMQQWK